MDRIAEFYEQDFFEKWKLTPPFRRYLSAERRRVKQTIQGGSVLEVGFGQGRVLELLINNCSSILGIEQSQRLYDRLINKPMAANIHLIHGNFLTFDFGGIEFDWILFAWNTFGNLAERRDAALEKALALLKPQGRVCLSVLAEEARDPWLEMAKLNPVTVTEVTEDYIKLEEGLITERFSMFKLIQLFRRAGAKGIIETLTDIAYWCECWPQK